MGWFKNLFKPKNESVKSELTENFSLREFDCHDGTPYPQKWIVSKLIPLCMELEKIRKHFDAPIIINSAYRTEEYNKKVGGSTNSQHVQGTAVDFKVASYSPREVAAWLREEIAAGRMAEGGVGDYITFTHYDIRGTKARWRGR